MPRKLDADEVKANRIQGADLALVMRMQMYLETKSLIDRIEMLDDVKRGIEELEKAISD